MNPPAIGTLRESHLHASLKEWAAEPGDRFEVSVDGFVIDIVRGDQLIEIQTRGFSSMRRKLDVLLDTHPMRIVHPIAGRKWIVKAPHRDRPSSRRLSPRHGTVHDIFAELVSFPNLVDHPNLTIDVVITDEEEFRKFDGNRSRRRKGWAVVDRRLIEVTSHTTIGAVADLAALLPADLPEHFTTAHLANAIARPRRVGQQMAYCLRETGAIEIAGKDRSSLLYRIGGNV